MRQHPTSRKSCYHGLTPRLRVYVRIARAATGAERVPEPCVTVSLGCGQGVVGIVAVHPSFSDADRTLATCSSEYRDTLVNNLGPSLTFSFAGFFLRKYFRWSTFQQPVEHADALSHLLRARHKYSMHMHTFF